MTAQFITVVVLIVGMFYWMDRKLSGLQEQVSALVTELAVIKQMLTDHIDDPRPHSAASNRT